MTSEEFLKCYSGIALQFTRGENFESGGEWPSLFTQIRTLLSSSWNALTAVVACALMLTLLSLVLPISLAIFVDEVLNNHGSSVGVVVALFGGGVLVYLTSWLKHRFLERLAIRISVIGYERSLSKLLRLPVEFF